MTDVKPGQVWADNDPRSAGRTLRVERIEGGKAGSTSLAVVCTILTNSDETQAWLDSARHGERARQRDMRGKTTRIKLARFKPTRTGYRLARDTQYGIRWPTGSVFAFPSREAAEDALREDGRGIGVLVVHDYGPGISEDWHDVILPEPMPKEG